MPYTMEQFQKDYIKAHIGVLDAEEVLSKFKAEEVLSKFKTEERLKGLGAEEIEFYLEKLKKGKSYGGVRDINNLRHFESQPERR